MKANGAKDERTLDEILEKYVTLHGRLMDIRQRRGLEGFTEHQQLQLRMTTTFLADLKMLA